MTETIASHDKVTYSVRYLQLAGVSYRRFRLMSSASNAPVERHVFALPSHGTQPQFWSETWRRKELLADLDILSGNVFETDNVDDLIARLDAAAAAVDAAKAH